MTESRQTEAELPEKFESKMYENPCMIGYKPLSSEKIAINAIIDYLKAKEVSHE